MVIMSADVTNEIKKMTHKLVEAGIYKSQSEVVRDAIRQLAYRYKIQIESLNKIRKIVAKASKKSNESLSKSVTKLREEL